VRITKEHKRLARKKGWYDGKAGAKKEKYPYEEAALCIEYEEGYYQGLDSKGLLNEMNPHGEYK